MTRADEERSRFEGEVIASLKMLGEKIEENKTDLNGRIDKLFDLLEKRDESCRETHDRLNKDVGDLRVNGALAKDKANASSGMWNKLLFALIGAAFTLGIWLIQNTSVKGK